MKIRRRRFQFAALLICFSWHGLAAALPTPESRIPHGFRFFMEADYISTKANFDDSGEKQDLLFGRYYKNYRTAFGAERWLSPDSSLLMELGTAFAESFGSGVTRQNSSVTEALIGYRKVWSRAPALLVPEFTFAFPFNRVDKNTENVMTGEGAIAAEAGIWAMFPMSWARPYSRLGFRYRDDDRASHLLWQLGSQFKIPGTLLFVGLKGSSVVVDDAHSDNPNERNLTKIRVNGGSSKYYAVNPSDMSLHLGFIWELKKDWRLTAEYDQTLSGKNTADGFTATLGLQWIMRTKSTYRPPPRRRRAAVTAPEPPPEVMAAPEPQLPPAPAEEATPIIRETPKVDIKIKPAAPHSSKLPPVKKSSPKSTLKPKPEPQEEDTSLKDIQDILGN